MAKILLIEDDQDLTVLIHDALESEKHLVEVAHSGLDGRECLLMSKYDAVILDWDLPGLSGLEVLKAFRAAGGNTPVMFLTGMADLADKEIGFTAGGDDYLTKPFEMKELILRLRAILRRPAQMQESILKVRDLELNAGQHRLLKNGAELKLFPKEFTLLEFLMRHPNQIFSADNLLKHVWHSDSSAGVETLRQSLARLRQTIDDDRDNPLIKTIYGVGYRLEP
jgi:DNA-binding response OmpR family regulator